MRMTLDQAMPLTESAFRICPDSGDRAGGVVRDRRQRR